MNRFVFDTNTIVSALLFDDSTPGMSLLKASNLGTILISEELVRELRDVLARPRFDRYISISERSIFLQVLIRESELVAVSESIQVCRDPKDDRILELAVNGGARYIVTGDNDLLILNPFRGVTILTPADFLNLSF